MIKHLVLIFLIGIELGNSTPVSKTTSAHAAYPTITTPLGDVQGSILNTRLGRHIYAFRGLRYGKAPIDNLRFQAPEIADKWEGIYNATMDGPACPQACIKFTSEDCLLLNVYTNKLPKGTDIARRPTIVFFHSGDFTNNSAQSNNLGPQYLLDQDVVLVTANYRLGVLGFLNSGDKEATGNFGLKDQVAVLKWVKANIASFGGNPNSVTIAGGTAGGVSVSLHLVSPLSKGLFHRAIVMSGSSFGNIPIPPNNLDLAKKLARALKCSDDTSSTILKCLKTKSAEELTEIVSEINDFGNDPFYTWSPTIEKDFSQDRFLASHPIEYLTNGNLAKVPIMIGSVANEFGCRAYELIGNETQLAMLDKEFEKYAPISFMFEKNTENSKIISKELRKFYFGDSKLDSNSLAKLSELYSDSLVGFGINRAVEMFAEKNNESVYYYHFNFKGKYSNFYVPKSEGIPYDVVNSDDLLYLFQSTSFQEFKETDLESTMIQKMITVWGNFAESGKPIPTATDILDNTKWESYNPKTKNYMEIGSKYVVREALNEKRFAEWDKLIPINKYIRINSG